MPSKLIVPALLENDGSWTHKLKIEPVFESDIISSCSREKDAVPDAAFIALSALETYAPTENVPPTLWEPEEGEKYKVAASTTTGKKRTQTNKSSYEWNANKFIWGITKN